MQEVCGCSGLVMALVLRFAGDQRGLIALWTILPDAEHLSVVDKSAFADTLCEAARSHT